MYIHCELFRKELPGTLRAFNIHNQTHDYLGTSMLYTCKNEWHSLKGYSLSHDMIRWHWIFSRDVDHECLKLTG